MNMRVFIFFLFLYTASAIKCYQCGQGNFPDCPTYGLPKLSDCRGLEFEHCSKTVTNFNGKTLIRRGCVNDEPACNGDNDEGYFASVFCCKGEACNHSKRLQINIALLISMILFVILNK